MDIFALFHARGYPFLDTFFNLDMPKPVQIRGGYVARKPTIPAIPATLAATLPSHGDRQLDLFEALLRVNAPADVLEEVITRSRCPLRLRHAIIVELSKSEALTVEKAKLVTSMATKLSREWSSTTNALDATNTTERQLELWRAMVICHSTAEAMEEVFKRMGASLPQRHDLILELSKSRILTVEKERLVRLMALQLSKEWVEQTKAMGGDSKMVCELEADSKTKTKMPLLRMDLKAEGDSKTANQVPDLKQQIELNRIAFEQDILEYLFATESGAIVPPQTYRGINFRELKNKWIVYANEKFVGAADERDFALHSFADIACYVVQLAPDGLSAIANTAGCAVPSKN